MRGIFAPIPNYIESDRTADCTVQEAIEIEILLHNTIPGRIDGSAYTGAGYIMRLGLIIGDRAVELYRFPGGNLIIRIRDLDFISQEDAMSDMRAQGTALASFSHFLVATQVVFRGLGFPMTTSWDE